jgi:hypothetical protein
MSKQREAYENKIKLLEDRQILELDMSQAMSQTTADDLVRQLQHDHTTKELEFEREKRRIMELEKTIKLRKLVIKKLEKKLIQYNMQISELNLISQELGRRVSFILDLAPNYLEDETAIHSAEDVIRVRIMNEDEGQIFFWDINKLNDRQYLIREMLEKYFETETLEKIEKEHDPFWDPEEPIDLGRAFISLKPVSLLFDVSRQLKIFYETEVIGTVQLKLEPCDHFGQPLTSDDVSSISDCIQLIGKDVSFSVRITKANINPRFTKNCFFQYRLAHDDFNNIIFKTSIVQSESGCIDFDYFGVHSLDNLDNSGLVFLSSSKV